MQESANESFERLAAEFKDATGMLCPGKDSPAAYQSYTQEERDNAFKYYVKGREAGIEFMRQSLAIAKAEGKA